MLARGCALPAEALVADVRKRLRKDHPAPTWAEDVERALSLDRFDLPVEVVRREGLLVGTSGRIGAFCWSKRV